MANKQSYDLEAVYDEKIYPLMAQIIAICKEHNMPMLATFQYAAKDVETGDGEFLLCTTALLERVERPVSEALYAANSTVLNGINRTVAFTITQK